MRGIQERKKIIKIIILKRPLRDDNTKQIYESSMLCVTSFYMIHVIYFIDKREKFLQLFSIQNIQFWNFRVRK